MTSDDANGVHIPRALPHSRSTSVFVTGVLSIASLGATFLTFAAHFTVFALLAGLAAVSIGRRVIDDIDASPTLFCGRGAVMAATTAGGVATGLAACVMAGWIAVAL